MKATSSAGCSSVLSRLALPLASSAAKALPSTQSLIQADANRQRSIAGKAWRRERDPETSSRAVKEYMAASRGGTGVGLPMSRRSSSRHPTPQPSGLAR